MTHSIVEKALWVWCAGVVLAMVAFNITPLLKVVPWFHITLGCNTFIFLLELYLDIRQSFTMRAYRSPSANWTHVQYHIENIQGLLNFSRTESTFGFIMECCALYWGVLPWLYDTMGVVLAESRFQIDVTWPVTRGTFYLLVISLFSSIVRLPFEMYRAALVDRHDGFTKKGWFRQLALDQIKMFIVSLFIGLPMLAITLALFYKPFQYQWLLIIVFTSTVALFFSDMYPSLAFLFNNFQVLEDGQLRSDIDALSKKLDFPLHQVYTIDGSTRVSHSNAFLMGIWSSSIVLYDNLIKQLSNDEILSIIGHEMGHHKFKHSWKHLFIQIIFLGNFIYLFSSVVNLEVFYTSFGFKSIDASVGLVLFSYLYSTFANLLRFVTNLIRREFEYAADRYAIENGLDIKKALTSMQGEGTFLKPDKFFSLYYYSHPSLMERLESIDHITNTLNKKVN